MRRQDRIEAMFAKMDAERDEQDDDENGPRCPDCGRRSLVTRQYFPATRIDPACSAGGCTTPGCRYEWG